MIISQWPFVHWMVKKYLNVGTAFKSHSWWTLKDRSYHNPKSTRDVIQYFICYYYYWQQSEHYRVPSFHSLFSQVNTEINYICPSVCYMCNQAKKILSLSPVTQSFSMPFFFVVSSICLYSCSNHSSIDASDFVDSTEYMMHNFRNI